MQRTTLLIVFTAILNLFGMQPASSAEEVKIGMTISLTGEFADVGQAQSSGTKMWADDINARGALLGRKVELVHYDDGSDPEKSARLYERLINEDRVDLLLGPYSTEVTLAASTVAEEHNFPMVTVGAASQVIWARGYRNIFGVDTSAPRYMNAFLAFAKEQGIQRLALVHANAQFPREVAEGVRAWARANGLEIVFDEEYDLARPGFSGLVQRMLRTDAEAVIGGTYLADSVAFLKQAKAQGLTPKVFVFTVGPALPEFDDALGKDADGIMGVAPWMRSAYMPMAQDFSYRYKRKFGRNAGYHAAMGYGAGQVLEAAVRLAGTLEKDKLRAQLGELKFRSLIGHYRVDDTGKQIGKESFVMQWQDGHRRLVFPERFAEREALFPAHP